MEDTLVRAAPRAQQPYFYVQIYEDWPQFSDAVLFLKLKATRSLLLQGLSKPPVRQQT